MAGSAITVAEIEALLKLKDELTPALQHAGKNAGAFHATWTGMMQGFGQKVFDKVWEGVKETVKWISELGVEGAKIIAIEKEFEKLAEASGNGAKALEALKLGFRGTVDETDIMSAAMKPLSLGLKVTNEDLTTMAQASRILAVRMGTDAVGAFGSLSRATALANERMLRRVGITINAQAAEKKYADSIGKSVDQLTKAEEKEAKRQAILQKLRDTVAQSGEKEMDFAEQMKRVHASMKDMEETFQKAVASSPPLIAAAGFIADAFEIVAEWFKENDQIVRNFVSGALVMLSKGIQFSLQGANLLIEGYRKVINTFYDWGAELTVVIAGLKAVREAISSPSQASAIADEFNATVIKTAISLKALKEENNSGANAVSGLVTQIGVANAEFMALASNTGKAADGHKKLSDETKTTAVETDKGTQAFKKMSESLANDLTNAMASSVGGLQGELIKIGQTIKAKMQEVSDGVKTGMSGEHAAELRKEIEQLGTALTEAAKKAERLKVLGKTFQDLQDELRNFDDTLAASQNDLTQFTDAALANMEQYLLGLQKAGIDVGERLIRVQQYMKGIGLATDETTKQTERYREALAYTDSLREAADEAEAERQARAMQRFDDIKNLLGAVDGLLLAIGMSANGAFGSMIEGALVAMETVQKLITAETTLQQVQALVEQATSIVNKGSVLGGAMSGAMTGFAVGGPLGAGIGAVAGGLLGLFGKAKKAREEAKKLATELKSMQDEFVKSMGGLDKLKSTAGQAGISLDKLFAAKNKEQLASAIDEIKGKLGTWNEAHEKLNAAVEKYGFTLAEMGPKFAQQKLDEQAASLLEDYQLLTAAGADHVAIITRMGPAINDFVNSAVAAGGTVPEAMRPIIEEMITNKTLLDANGDAYESVETSGIQFAQTMTEQFQTLVDKITELVNALLGISDVPVPSINIPYHYTQEGPGPGYTAPHREDASTEPGYASGSGGIRDFGTGTRVILHGRERVQTEKQAQETDRGVARETTIRIPISIDGRVLSEVLVRRNAAGLFSIK